MIKYSRSYWFLMIALFILSACQKNKCGLHEFSSVKAIKFSLDKWHGLNLSKELKVEDPYTFEALQLEQREQMLCDMVATYLIRGEYCQDFVDLLGEPRDSIGAGVTSRYLYPTKLDSTLASQGKTPPLIYSVGYNASGACHLVLFLDEKGKYMACYRAVAI